MKLKNLKCYRSYKSEHGHIAKDCHFNKPTDSAATINSRDKYCCRLPLKKKIVKFGVLTYM